MADENENNSSGQNPPQGGEQNPSATPPPAAEPPSANPPPVQNAPVDDIESYKKSVEELAKIKPAYDEYSKFDQLLASDEELAAAIVEAAKAVATRRQGGQGQQPPAQNPPPSQPYQGGQNQGPDPVTQLRNEIRFKDYVGEFQRVAQAQEVPQEIITEAFNGTMKELVSLEADPLGNFNPALIEKAFKVWNDRMELITKARNSAYQKKIESADVPKQGSGSAPKQTQEPLGSYENRMKYIADGLKAATITH